MGEATVKKIAGLSGEVGGGLSGLMQGLFVDMGHAVIFANKEEDYRRTTDKKGQLQHFFGKIADSQTNKKGRAYIG